MIEPGFDGTVARVPGVEAGLRKLADSVGDLEDVATRIAARELDPLRARRRDRCAPTTMTNSSPRISPHRLLGRDVELEMLRTALVPGGAALILGAKGAGKSALLAATREAAIEAGFSATLAHASERTDLTLRQLLAAGGTGPVQKSLGARALQGRLLGWCSERRRALFLDDADRANGVLLRDLRRIVLETSACVVIAGRTGPGDPPERLRYAVFAGSREVRLGPLPLAAARTLASARLGLDAALAADIARESGRIPAAIVEMARRHREPRYRFGGRTSWALLLADLRVENRI